MLESSELQTDKSPSSGLVSPDAGIFSKVQREMELLGDGLSAGFCSRASQAANHPALTAMRIVVTAAFGAGLRVMSQAGGGWGTAAKIGSFGFAAALGADVASRGIPTATAMLDAWNHPMNLPNDEATVAQYAGSALFDYPLMALSTVVGSASAKVGMDFLKPALPDMSPLVPPLSEHFHMIGGTSFAPPRMSWSSDLLNDKSIFSYQTTSHDFAPTIIPFPRLRELITTL